MAALGQTISGVAHELNNPLATILTWAERLAERSLDDNSRRGVEVILGESGTCRSDCAQSADLCPQRQSTRAMIDVNHVVRGDLPCRAYEQRLTNIEVLRHSPRACRRYLLTSHQIQQLLLNLSSTLNRRWCRPTAADRSLLRRGTTRSVTPWSSK